MYGPKAGAVTWLALVAAALSLLAPVTLVFAAPALTRPLGDASTGRDTPPALPSTGSARLADAIDPLPIVVRDLPDAPSRQAAAAYDHLRVQDPAAARALFIEAWQGLSAPPDQGLAVSDLAGELLGDTQYQSLDPRLQASFDYVAVPAFSALAGDPRNADRLSNAAVVLFDEGVAEDASMPNVRPSKARALMLLRQIARSFPDSRAAHLNLAFLTSILETGSGIGPQRPAPEARATANAWLAAHPADRTARLLTASLQMDDADEIVASTSLASASATAGLGDALRTLRPLVDDRATAALGNAATGDAYLTAARALAARAPYIARRFAEAAEEAYSRAFSAVPDPGILAGESLALGVLGDRGGALAAQREAVEVAPDSSDLLLGLAIAEERIGDFGAMRRAASQAMTTSDAVDQTFVASRMTAGYSYGHPGAPSSGNYGFEGYSFGVDRPRMSVMGIGLPGGGPTYLVATDPVPARIGAFPMEDIWHWSPVPEAALEMSLAASLLLADPRSAAADLDHWTQALDGSAGPGLTSTLRAYGEQFVEASGLVAGTVPVSGRNDEGLSLAESQLRDAAALTGQTRLLARLPALCHRAVSPTCEGEASYLLHDYATAATVLEKAASAASPSLGVRAGLDLEAGFASERAGDLDRAGRLFRAGAVDARRDSSDRNSNLNYAAAGELMGGLLLEMGQPGRAAGYLERVGPALDLYTAAAGTPAEAQPGIRGLLQHASSNHGVALLWAAQPARGAEPDCSRSGGVCEEALADFRAALREDPANPYYLMNLGWTDRLVHDTAGERVALAAAASDEPGDYPALNDLGVIRSTTGDTPGARAAFAMALAAAPGYDLAAWNLGQASLQSGILGIPTGEAYLAQAIREDPALREAPNGYRADDRVYRSAFGAPLRTVQAGSLGDGYGTGALIAGGVVAFTAFPHLLGMQLEEWLGELLAKPELPFLPALVARLRARRPRRLADLTRRRPWLLTGVILATLTIWAAWPSSGAAPMAAIALALLATFLAAAANEGAHLATACLLRVGMRPAVSVPGIMFSLVLFLVGAPCGPFAGHEALPGYKGSRTRWVYLAGPAANVLVGAAYYALSLAQPMPFLRLAAEVQLAAAAFSLLPMAHLDGAALRRRKRELFMLLPPALGLSAALGGAALRFGWL